jgi:hypothetical protein
MVIDHGQIGAKSWVMTCGSDGGKDGIDLHKQS